MSIRTRRLFTTAVVVLGSLASALPAHAGFLANHNETLLADHG